jgi:hypothetical protein
MEVTQEHKTQIEKIISGIECPKGFVCYKSGFEEICKAEIFIDGELVECLEECPLPCKLSFGFGFGYFCKCPLRRYIAQNFNR